VGRSGIIWLLAISLVIVLLPGAARAQFLSGNVELFSQNGLTKETDATGLTTSTRSRTFLQRYNLNFDSQLYPQVHLRAGIRAEETVINSAGDNGDFRMTDTLLVPIIALTVTNPFVHAGASYEEREDKVVSGGISITNYRDTTNAFLGFKPEGLPTLDLLYVGTKWYDKEHLTTDRDENLLQLTSTYRPVRSLQLYYSIVSDDVKDLLLKSETESLTQSARVGYSDRFFNDRWILSGNFNATRQDIDFTRGTIGNTVRVQLFPIAGLSSISDQPQLGALSTNAALIDGNLTASSGINIGQLPSQTGDTRRRNVGLDFGVQTTVSTLYVWVDRSLPTSIANSFSWDVYTSNDNQNWFFAQTVFPANFGQFDNRFEISFSAVSARYIKVVTRPLSVAIVPPPGFDISNIFITEVQGFFDQPVVLSPEKKTTTVVTSNAVDVYSRFYIIQADRHTLLYDLYYRYTRFETSGMPPTSPSTLINSLIGFERFSRVFSGSAKMQVENDEFANKTRDTYTDAEASLTAAWNSLRKLAHTFVVTAKQETYKRQDLTKDTQTASFTNTAEVYPGINAYLTAIENMFSAETGTANGRGNDTSISLGTDITPHRALTINASYSWDESVQQGSATSASVLGATGRRSTNTFVSLAYNPFSSLYLYGSVQETRETGKPTVRSTSFNGSWSTAVTGGALEFRIIYTENQDTASDARSRTYGPYAKYRMNIRATLEASYLISTNDSNTGSTDTDTLNTTFRWFF
jgi:hypothetical protein